MKRSLVADLIENSKVSKRVDGEIGAVSYDNIHTPDNHEKGKKSKLVKPKSLGERPGGNKKVTQVKPPANKERRSMSEDHAWPRDKDAALKPSTAKNKDEGLVKPKVVKTSPVKTVNIATKIGDEKKHAGFAKGSHKTRKLPKSYMGGVSAPYGTVKEDIQDWQQTKNGATMNQKDMPNRDEGQKTPKAEKKSPAGKGSISKRATDKDMEQVKGPKGLPNGYQEQIPVTVKKVYEELSELAGIIGKFSLDIGDLNENFPDGMTDWHHRTYLDGDDDDDSRHERAEEYAAEAMKKKMDEVGESWMKDYTEAHPEDKVGALYNYFDYIYGAAMPAYADESLDVDKEFVKSFFMDALRGRVEDQHLTDAVDEYLGENVAEDHLDRPRISAFGKRRGQRSIGQSMNRLNDRLINMGYTAMGGGFTGGRKTYRGPAGDVVVSVHPTKEDHVQSWQTEDGRQGTKPDDLIAYLDTMGGVRHGGRREMSSGGAVGTGATANGPVHQMGNARRRSDLFAHAGSPAFQTYAKEIQGGKDLAPVMDMMHQDSRLSDEEKGELEDMIRNRKPPSPAKASRMMGRMLQPREDAKEPDDIVNIPQTVDEYIAKLDPYMSRKYFLTWAEMAGDREPIQRAIEAGQTPEEFADWWAQKHGLDAADDMGFGGFGEADPCWDGYQQYGMKDKGGHEVPNCVPAKEDMGSPHGRVGGGHDGNEFTQNAGGKKLHDKKRKKIKPLPGSA